MHIIYVTRKYLSIVTKLRHYNTAIKSEILLTTKKFKFGKNTGNKTNEQRSNKKKREEFWQKFRTDKHRGSLGKRRKDEIYKIKKKWSTASKKGE